ncbi:MAG: MFS transporter [Gammaproteobacteria bacterium]|nr:MFS transporter [Gammaproteobacteria bacterium]
MSDSSAFTPQERHATFALCGVFFLRMMGLFMLVPVLALYADKLAGATPFMVGLTLGVYGLTQACLQIPFGLLSDRVGRRPVITAGLLIFTAGSVVAAFGQHILPVMIGRAVQGAGAVSGASLALASDLTREQQRTKVMALIGIAIGIAFSVAFVVGPMIDGAFGLRGLFLASGLMGLLALPVLHYLVPKGEQRVRHAERLSWAAVSAPELRVLYFGVLALHLVLAASFVAIPVDLREGLGLPTARHHSIYLPVLLVSIVLVAPLIRLAGRGAWLMRISLGAIAGLVIAEALLWLAWHQRIGTIAALVVFFTAFNFLEASLPSLISRVAPPAHKGTALGAYATFQFFGMFIGGTLGGFVAGRLGFAAVPGLCAILCVGWLVAALRAPTGALTARLQD